VPQLPWRTQIIEGLLRAGVISSRQVADANHQRAVRLKGRYAARGIRSRVPLVATLHRRVQVFGS
jgi:trehalose-6-phosphate synthase